MTSYPRHRIASLTTASGYQRPTDKLFFQKRKELGTFLLPELANHSLREMPRQRVQGRGPVPLRTRSRLALGASPHHLQIPKGVPQSPCFDAAT